MVRFYQKKRPFVVADMFSNVQERQHKAIFGEVASMYAFIGRS